MSEISDKALEVENIIRFNLVGPLQELLDITDALLEAEIEALRANRPGGLNNGLSTHIGTLRATSPHSREAVIRAIRNELARSPAGAALLRVIHRADNEALSDVYPD